jgi:hypothetical protein
MNDKNIFYFYNDYKVHDNIYNNVSTMIIHSTKVSIMIIFNKLFNNISTKYLTMFSTMIILNKNSNNISTKFVTIFI